MSKYEWLLLIHVGGAFAVLAGALFAAVLNLAALRRDRPGEIALLLGLIRVGVVLIVLGMLVTLVFGFWLIDETAYEAGDAWISAALVLWVATLLLGGLGGRRDRKTRALAEQLAAQGNAPSAELQARLRDPVSLVLSYGSGVLVLAILVLMIWKPGS